jgi:hypothetical protein
MTIDNAPDHSLAEQQQLALDLQVDSVDRVEITSPPPRKLRRTTLTVLSYAGQALLIAMTAILFLIVLAFVLDDPDPVRTPSQSASMRY